MFKIVVACIYSGYRFAKIYSGTQSLGNIEFSTNINYYEDQAWTWMFFLIVGAVVLLIGKRHALKGMNSSLWILAANILGKYYPRYTISQNFC